MGRWWARSGPVMIAGCNFVIAAASNSGMRVLVRGLVDTGQVRAWRPNMAGALESFGSNRLRPWLRSACVFSRKEKEPKMRWRLDIYISSVIR